MTKARNVAFLNAFRTMAEAEDQLAKLADPGVVIQLWKPDQTLFTVCTQSGIDSLQEELDAAKKVSMRQLKDHRTKSYTIWVVNEPPQVVIPRSKK